MESLSRMPCEACRQGSPMVTDAEKAEFLPQIPEWRIETEDGVDQLVRVFEFPDFARALDFTNRVGAAAEEEQHHPALLTEWGRVTVRWWTHKIGGLHRNDFILAARSDELYTPSG